ncbi:MAG: TolC family protein [Fibrobacter sp.]|nr:TolC family protein [Fibrobacter sp.]
MNKNKVIILSIFTFAVAAFANGSWTLDACLKQAKQKSLQLESAKLREQQADINIKQAKANRYPNLDASIQNTLFDHPFVDNEDHYRLSLGLSGSYKLWDGGTTSKTIEANQLTKQAAVLETKQTERSVQESVLNAYMSLLAASENLRTANASVELAQAEFEHYGKLFEAGSITKKDLTQSQANVLQKQAAQLTAQLNVNTSKTTLRQLLELPESEDFSVEAPETAVTSPDSLEPIPSLNELQTTVKDAHPGLKSDSISVRAAKKNTEVAGTGSSITVTLGANSNTGLQAWESGAYGNQLKRGWQNSISLGINIPIIDGGVTTNKVLLAQVNESATQVSMQETAKSLENNIEKLYLNAQSADMQWKAAILQVEAEQEALLVADEQRNAGALTYTDYLSQKNALENAQVTLVNAKYTSLLARKLIDLYQGKLD